MPRSRSTFERFLDDVIRWLMDYERVRRRQAEGIQPTQRGREPIPRSVQSFVWRRDGGRCVQCGSNERLEFDHIVPHSRGGSNTERNIQLLCERCNRSKGATI
ncbi:MAG: HNH endonuclease [Fimbriimonadaceae bacterium]